ncbi:hypothetical protein ACFQH3_18915 [Haladaptatus sp. GCM10025707]|uniref:hypothetical protein n=1 Tax=unclassified Haladaptatus TaxID=2622732 RepID=UPI0023E79E2C|nr:hypothetical protein [Haladaptatus sp. QDMS2]
MSAARISQGARRHVAAGALFLVTWQVATLVGVPHRSGVVLGLYGFVLHTVAGKAYALVPSYFDRTLSHPAAPAMSLPLLSLGTVGLAVAPLDDIPSVIGIAGAVCWALGALVFVGAVGWTVRDNLTGRETGTGEVNTDRRWADRAANAFIPVVLAYLVAGSYETVAVSAALPTLTGRGMAGASHLLAAGVGALLIFAVGFRLLPRFLVSSPPMVLVIVVLIAGTVGPALVAGNLWGGMWFRVGAVAESIAVGGFAVAYISLFVRSERRRIGLYGPLVGVVMGVMGVALGAHVAFAGGSPGWSIAHYRLNLLGFLGLTIVGVAYQFYPPAVGTFPGANNRTALASMGCLAVGVGVEAYGSLAGFDVATLGGRLLAFIGASLYAYLLLGLFRERYGS